jgi:hypothetical protein
VAGAGRAGAAASEDAVACGADEDEDGCVGESLGVSAPLSSVPDARIFTPGAEGTAGAGAAGAGRAGAAASEDAVACGADEDEDGCVGESFGVSAPLSSVPDARIFTPGAEGTAGTKGRPPRSSGPARAFGATLSGPMSVSITGPNSLRRASSSAGLTVPTKPLSLLLCRLSVAESEEGNGRLEQTHCLIEPSCYRHRVERVQVTTSPLGNHPREQQEQKATTTTTIWPTTREEVKNWRVIS